MQSSRRKKTKGNKMNNVDVVYTPWDNLKKTGDMVVGQIGFKDDKKVKKVRVARRINEIVNRLNKTERKEDIDYRAEREERDAKERQKLKEKQRAEKELEKEKLAAEEREKQMRSYEGVFCDEKMHSNYDGGNDSDNFM